jgi:hypothetical protein
MRRGIYSIDIKGAIAEIRRVAKEPFAIYGVETS